MSIMYKCDRCGEEGECTQSSNIPGGWGYIDDSDLCHECFASYREFKEAHMTAWSEKLEAWFKEIK